MLRSLFFCFFITVIFSIVSSCSVTQNAAKDTTINRTFSSETEDDKDDQDNHKIEVIRADNKIFIKDYRTGYAWSPVLAHGKTLAQAIDLCHDYSNIQKNYSIGKNWRLPNIEDFEEASQSGALKKIEKFSFWSSSITRMRSNAFVFNNALMKKEDAFQLHTYSVVCIARFN